MRAKYHKNRAHCDFETKSAQVFNFGSRSAIPNIIFMINELDLLWLPNFIALGTYFIFEIKFFSNEGIDTCFNVEYVLLDRNFYFPWWLLGGYCPLPCGYRSLPVGYFSLLVLNACYRPLLLFPTFSMNDYQMFLLQKSKILLRIAACIIICRFYLMFLELTFPVYSCVLSTFFVICKWNYLNIFLL